MANYNGYQCVDDSDSSEEEEIEFPMPPQFYQLYNAENVAQGNCPPPPPVPRKFTVFGQKYNLKGALVPSINHKAPKLYVRSATMEHVRAQMKSLNASIMACFLDIVQILIDCPDSKEREEKIEHLRWLFVNFHQIINEIRPIEAMHCLYVLQQQQNSDQADLHARMSESLMKCQSAMVSIDETIDRLPEIPLPPVPEFLFQSDYIQDFRTENMTWVLEDALDGTVDKVLLNSIKNAKDEIDENGYILKYWTEPPKDHCLKENKKKRSYFRDKVVRIKDPVGRRKKLKSPPPDYVRLLESEDDEQEKEDEEPVEESEKKESESEESEDDDDESSNDDEIVEDDNEDQESSSDENNVVDEIDNEENESDTNVDADEQSDEDEEEDEEDTDDGSDDDSSESNEDEENGDQEVIASSDKEESDTSDVKLAFSDEIYDEDEENDNEEEDVSSDKVENDFDNADDEAILISDDEDGCHIDERSLKEYSSELEDEQEEEAGSVQKVELTETVGSEKSDEVEENEAEKVEDTEMKDATEADDEEESEKEEERSEAEEVADAVVLKREIKSTTSRAPEVQIYYDRRSFGRYVNSRGVAPDLDREVLAVRSLKMKLRQRVEEMVAKNDGEEIQIVDDPQPCSSKTIPVIEIERPINRKRKRETLKRTASQWSQVEYIAGLSDSSDLSDDTSEEDEEDEMEDMEAFRQTILSTIGEPYSDNFDETSSNEEEDDQENDDDEEVEGSSNVDSEEVESKVRSTVSDPTEELSTNTSGRETRQSPRPYSALEEEAEEDDDSNRDES